MSAESNIINIIINITVETKDKQYPFLQNNRLLLQTMTALAAQLKHSQHNDRSRSIYTTDAHE